MNTVHGYLCLTPEEQELAKLSQLISQHLPEYFLNLDVYYNNEHFITQIYNSNQYWN